MDKPKKPTLDDIFAEIGFPEPPKLIFSLIPRQRPEKRRADYPVRQCGKVTYPSERVANQAIHNRLNKGTGGAKNLIAYYCGKCGGWHMTSRTTDGLK